MTRPPIGRTPRAPGRIDGTCQWCHDPVQWLVSTSTDRPAPIDAEPVPGGNVMVLRTTDGKRTGQYAVIGKPEERTLFDATEAVDLDARPTLYLNHWVTCRNATARRMARDRATKRTATRKDPNQ